MFKQLGPSKMTREEKIKRVTEYAEERIKMCNEIVTEPDPEYPIEDCLSEDSGVDIKNIDNIKNLSDEDFEIFFDKILFKA